MKWKHLKDSEPLKHMHVNMYIYIYQPNEKQIINTRLENFRTMEKSKQAHYKDISERDSESEALAQTLERQWTMENKALSVK